LLTDWNETHVDLDGEQTMHGLIEKNANETPDAIAVVSENTSLTYRELDESANLLAAQLISAGVRSNDHVGLFLERSLDMVVGILGILKAGAAFVPLDPTYPTAHLRYIASDAQVAAIVTQQRLRAAVPYLDARVIELDSPPTAVRATAVNRPVLAENTAYVLYTSGSEGRPKGVPVSHCNLVHSTLARQHFYREPVDRFLLLSSLAFDSAMVGIFWTLVDGGTLVLPPPRLEQDLDKLTALLSSQQVSHVLCLPSLYEIVLQHARKDQLQTLRTVIVAGETCTPSTLTRHLAVVPWAKLFNEYGPTEATVWCVACELTEASVKGPIPIGRPIANTQVYLLDRHGRPVPPGICGELFVAGPGVTKGYWNQPELTKKRFAQNPFSNDSGARMYRTGDLAYYLPDGKLVFAGRHDHQVKIRGYRIELGEIESKLRQHPNVKEAVVVAPAVRNSSPEDVPLDSDEIVDRLLALGPTRAGRLLDEVLAIPSDDMDGQLARDFP
jgi:amino acid adenylation domain-containing protein